MSFNFWGQVLEGSEGIALSEALKSSKTSLSVPLLQLSSEDALRNRDNFQQLMPCSKPPPKLGVAGAGASEVGGGKVHTPI